MEVDSQLPVALAMSNVEPTLRRGGDEPLLGRTTAIVDAAAVGALSEARHPAVLQHSLLERFASSMQAHRDVVGRDAEGLRRFRERRSPHVNESEDRGVAGVDTTGLTYAAATHDLGFIAWNVGNQSVADEQTLPACPFARFVRHRVAVNAIEPRQHPSRVLQRSGALDGPHRSHLEHIFDLGQRDAGAHEGHQLIAVVMKRYCNELGLSPSSIPAGHVRELSSLSCVRAPARGFASALRAAGASFAAAAAIARWWLMVAGTRARAIVARALSNVGHGDLHALRAST